LRQKRLSDLQKDFINNMTHEFKTPISSINIAASVIGQDPNVIANYRLSKYTHIIQEQNQRLNNQVEKVLNVAKMENESFKLKIESIDIIKLLKSVVDAEQLKLKDGHIIFSSNCSSRNIFADKLHITNVLHNIIDNATKYCSKSPQICIAFQDGEVPCLTISDNGIGIEKEHLKLIFNKFYRVSTGNVHDVKGFGLGLFYVNQVCLSHGWKLEVKSIINEGTSFFIYFSNQEKIQSTIL
jgi:two-component system phosphate regulon sensor histidine kinase PhoR